MRGLLYFFLLFSNIQAVFAQKASSEINIDKKLYNINHNLEKSDHKEILLLLIKAESEKLGYESGILQSGNQLMSLYQEQNRYKDVLTLGTQLKKITRDKSDKGSISDIYRNNALALNSLGLHDSSLEDLRKAIRYANSIVDTDQKQYLLSLCYQNMTLNFSKKQLENPKLRDSIIYYLTKSNNAAKLINDNNGKIPIRLKYAHISSNKIQKGIFYLEQADEKNSIELAEKYLSEAWSIYENTDYKAKPEERILILNQMSWLYMEKKEYKKSIEYAMQAIALEKQFKNPAYRAESFEFLTNGYLEIGNKTKSKFYMNQYKRLKDSIGYADKHHTNFTLKELAKEADDNRGKNSNSQWVVISILIVILISLTIASLYWRKKNRVRMSSYEQVIENLKKETTKPTLEKKNIDTEFTDSTSDITSSKNFIASETEIKLLRKLESFEKQEKFIKKDITISYLSNQWNTNPKYLSEIIKKYKSQNYSNYIHSLRINYIVHKLYEDPKYREYKITYLADECGYASSQVFVLAFKRINGVTPSFFIEKLKESEI